MRASLSFALAYLDPTPTFMHTRVRSFVLVRAHAALVRSYVFSLSFRRAHAALVVHARLPPPLLSVLVVTYIVSI